MSVAFERRCERIPAALVPATVCAYSAALAALDRWLADQARAADAGIEGRVSGHSLRIGAAQSLAAAGAGLVELQQAGRWDSPSMPAHYARGQLAARGAVARLRHDKGTR